MLLCDTQATLVRFDGAGYDCLPLGRVSRFARRELESSPSGDAASGSVRVRIPARNAGIFPAPGDYIVFGAVESIGSIAELKGRDYIRVIRVTDNRRGDARVSHVAVVGR
ncbi:MAG: hypothetical protein HUJ65_03920 [Oscillospiraceae bacterium]|nr:hypothetical protein [Oscillospiraceae bacterium]